MVLRKGLRKAVGDRKTARKERDGKRRMGGRRIQKKGELDLSNPIIPPELDEDIDDDLAFDSDDEARYGAFFSRQEASNDAKAGARQKKSGKQAGRVDLQKEFDKLNAVGGGDAEGDDEEFGFSDDSRDEFDLSEMLDSKAERRAAKVSRRTKREGRKSAPSEKLTKEAESVLGPSADVNDDERRVRRPAGIHDLVQSTRDAPDTRRLKSALSNRKNILTEEVDELTKERNARAATREAVAGALKKYAPLLKSHKEVPHLKFPLPRPESNPVPGTMGTLTAAIQRRHDDQPVNPLAAEMSEILRAAGLGSLSGKRAKEALAGSHVPFESNEDGGEGPADGDAAPEQRINVGYMAKLKSMLTYEIAKRRRLNKIKSKTYRRILRKEKERDDERRQKALELLNPEAARARMQAKMEKLRAEERATQKHKNTSKWVKHAKQFAKFDNNTKDAIDEQHQLRQRLMAKMDEPADAEMAAAVDDMSESSEEEQRVDELLAGKASASSILWQQDDQGSAVADMTPTEKARAELRGMDFMKRGREKADAEMSREVAELQEDIQAYREGRELVHASKRQNKKARQRTLAEEEADEVAADASRDDAAENEQLRRREEGPDTSHPGPRVAAVKVVKGAGRLSVPDQKRHLQHDVVLPKRGGISATTDSTNSSAPLNAAVTSKGQRTDDGAEDEFIGARRNKAAVVVTHTRVPLVVAPPDVKQPEEKKPEEKKRAKQKRARGDGGSATAEAVDVSALPPSVASREDDLQEYLVARAFAMDEIDEDFLRAKEQQVESVMKPVDKNAALPGWGEWGGEDERLNKRQREKLEALDLERRIKKTALMKARADAKLDNVIINHDVDLVPDRQTLHMVPRPFSNPEEYARSMRQPIGPEWNTSMSFKEGTQPRITTTQGVVIDPLDLTMHKKKAKTVRRKRRVPATGRD